MYKISFLSITKSVCVLFCTNFLDAVYTERYMGTPAENSDSYKVSYTRGRQRSSYLFNLTYDLRPELRQPLFLTELFSNSQSQEL